MLKSLKQKNPDDACTQKEWLKSASDQGGQSWWWSRGGCGLAAPLSPLVRWLGLCLITGISVIVDTSRAITTLILPLLPTTAAVFVSRGEQLLVMSSTSSERAQPGTNWERWQWPDIMI